MMRNRMRAQKSAYVELGLQSNKMVLEHAFDLSPGCLPAWNLDAICCTRSDVDQLLELGMFKSLDGL